MTSLKLVLQLIEQAEQAWETHAGQPAVIAAFSFLGAQLHEVLAIRSSWILRKVKEIAATTPDSQGQAFQQRQMAAHYLAGQ